MTIYTIEPPEGAILVGIPANRSCVTRRASPQSLRAASQLEIASIIFDGGSGRTCGPIARLASFRERRDVRVAWRYRAQCQRTRDFQFQIGRRNFRLYARADRRCRLPFPGRPGRENRRLRRWQSDCWMRQRGRADLHHPTLGAPMDRRCEATGFPISAPSAAVRARTAMASTSFARAAFGRGQCCRSLRVFGHTQQRRSGFRRSAQYLLEPWRTGILCGVRFQDAIFEDNRIASAAAGISLTNFDRERNVGCGGKVVGNQISNLLDEANARNGRPIRSAMAPCGNRSGRRCRSQGQRSHRTGADRNCLRFRRPSRNVACEDNQIKGADYGIAFASVPPAGPARISGNHISDAGRARIVAMKFGDVASGDLFGLESPYAPVRLGRNYAD